MKKSIITFCCCLLCLAPSLYAQHAEGTDSLLQAIAKCETDTGKLSLEMKVVLYYYLHSNPDSALVYINDGLALARKTVNKKREGDFLQWKGIIYHKRSFYELGLENYQASIKVYEEIGYKKGVAAGLNNIGSTYFDDLADYALALDYFLQALKVKIEIDDKAGIAVTYSNIGNCYVELGQLDKAFDYLEKARLLYEQSQEKTGLGRIYNYLGNYYSIKGNVNEAIRYRNLALQISLDLKNSENESDTYTGIGLVYRRAKHFPQALMAYKQALAINNTIDYKLGRLNIFEGLYRTWLELKHYDSAYHYLEAYDEIKDTVQKRASDNRMAEMQVKFETERKEKEIEKLNGEADRKELLLARRKNQFFFLLGSALFLIISMLVFYYRYRQEQYKKMTGKELELKNLEKKQQEELMHAVVNTQEAERNKLSINLHDGLGQMLTAAKMNLNLCLDTPGLEQTNNLSTNIRKSVDMVQKALIESKNIATDLLPVNITETGMLNGIREICDNNNSVNPGLRINFSATNVPAALPEMVEINVFRICQEMITNIIKHSGASIANLQIFYRDNTLIIQMEDNGKGFDINATDKKGLGLRNIETRVKLVSGELNIDSSPGNGTTTTIYIPAKIENHS